LIVAHVPPRRISTPWPPWPALRLLHFRAFFFFSGHGVALSDANDILPSDIPDVAAEQNLS
jgi:hypothetical protein